MKPIPVPNAQEFSKLIKQHRSLYQEFDETYLKATAKVRKAGLRSLSERELFSILASYLLKWGKMGRVLGNQGCKAIASMLKELEPAFHRFENTELSTISLVQNEEEIKELYDRILNSQWTSKKGRVKRVGPTTTAKVLHLVNPYVFMIWDRKIREDYGFGETGEEYVRFMTVMQDWIRNLSPLLESLKLECGKTSTKIVDDYNWIKCWSEEKGSENV